MHIYIYKKKKKNERNNNGSSNTSSKGIKFLKKTIIFR